MLGGRSAKTREDITKNRAKSHTSGPSYPCLLPEPTEPNERFLWREIVQKFAQFSLGKTVPVSLFYSFFPWENALES